MPIKLILGAVSALGLLSISTAAQAGHCGGQNYSPKCNVAVQHIPGPAPQFDAMTVTSVNPMGHLRSVDFQRAPHVSIMRVHGMMPTANLSDAPIGFTGGCHSQSTQYCRQQGSVAAPPVVQQPLRPAGPRIGQGYDASKFTPRQYGENIFTPGIAHIPTSIVDRDPVRADMALNSGRAVPQPIANGGVAPRPSMVNHSYRMPPMMAPQSCAPNPQTMVGRPPAPSNGTYWEKVSGPTMIGNTMATQVICKRQMPTAAAPVHSGFTPQPQAHTNPYAGWTY